MKAYAANEQGRKIHFRAIGDKTRRTCTNSRTSGRRIPHFLDTGEVTAACSKKKLSANVGNITENTIIEQNIVFSQKHRAFFENMIGKKFHFNVLFQNWLKTNAGKTYDDAIEAYYNLLEQKKHNKTPIGKQFEYNTYIRDFYEDNKGKSLKEAILCWKYKKSIKGHNRYERSDLSALERPSQEAQKDE